MSIDVKKIREEAKREIDEERASKAKAQLKQVMRDIASTEQVLAGLKLKLADLETQIQDGTL